MKIYCCTDLVSTVSPFVLENEKVDGITIRLPISNFLFGATGYNESFFNQLINDIKVIRDYGKDVALGIIYGKYYPIMPNVRYVYIKDIHHQNAYGGTDAPIRQPVFWDEPYIKNVQNFFKWFSDKLKASEVYESIEQITVTGVNEKSEEMRCSDQNFLTPSDTAADAYKSAAKIWESVNYDTVKVKMAIKGFVDMFATLFPDKIITIPVLGTRSGFPCIFIDKVCLPNQREDIAKEILEYAVDSGYNVAAKCTALMIASGTPDKVVKSKAAYKVFQVERLLYDPPAPYPKSQLDQEAFQMVVENGRQYGATHIELFVNSLRGYPNVHG